MNTTRDKALRLSVKAVCLSPFPVSSSPLMHEKIKLCGVKLMEWSK